LNIVNVRTTVFKCYNFYTAAATAAAAAAAAAAYLPMLYPCNVAATSTIAVTAPASATRHHRGGAARCGGHVEM
jgi:hypothetical protein